MLKLVEGKERKEVDEGRLARWKGEWPEVGAVAIGEGVGVELRLEERIAVC